MPNDAISSIKPAGATGPEYDLKDPNAQPKTLTTHLTIEGQTITTVEAALAALNNKSGGGGSSSTILSQTLSAGSTTVTFTNVPTTGNKLIDVYTDKAGLNYTSVDDTTSGQLTYTFKSQSIDVNVYLVIKEVDSNG